MKTGPTPPVLAQAEARMKPMPEAQLHRTPAEPVLVVQGAGANAPDFTHLTKAEYVAWGKEEFARGRISLDDLFQVQIAGGDFDGTRATDATQHNFIAFFEGLIRIEVTAGRGAEKPQSMVPAYQHVLASMAPRLDKSV